MQQTYNFVIDSTSARHRLCLNGQPIATFPTLAAAEAEANKVANRAVPGTKLKFELDFKWTLSDLEMRGATLYWESGEGPSRPGEALVTLDRLTSSAA